MSYNHDQGYLTKEKRFVPKLGIQEGFLTLGITAQNLNVVCLLLLSLLLHIVQKGMKVAAVYFERVAKSGGQGGGQQLSSRKRYLPLRSSFPTKVWILFSPK